MKILESQEDIKFLVDKFYDKVGSDEMIGFFFNHVAKVDWTQHLPKMYAFWGTLLLGKASYKGNPMAVHFPINREVAIEKAHFEHWLQLWTATIKENFTGELAEMAIYKATNIANLMAYKMETAKKLE